MKRMFQTVAAVAFYQDYQTLEKFYILSFLLKQP